MIQFTGSIPTQPGALKIMKERAKVRFKRKAGIDLDKSQSANSFLNETVLGTFCLLGSATTWTMSLQLFGKFTCLQNARI